MNSEANIDAAINVHSKIIVDAVIAANIMPNRKWLAIK